MHHYYFIFYARLQAQYCKKSSTYFWVILVVAICVLAFYDTDENSRRVTEACNLLHVRAVEVNALDQRTLQRFN